MTKEYWNTSLESMVVECYCYASQEDSGTLSTVERKPKKPTSRSDVIDHKRTSGKRSEHHPSTGIILDRE